jgi:hypothetical protein
MSQLLKQSLCSTTWNSVELAVNKLNLEQPFDSYFRRVCKNGWVYYRLYPKQFNLCKSLVYNSHNQQNSYYTQYIQCIKYVKCAQCMTKFNGFIQFSCNPNICNLTDDNSHVIDICNKCIQSNNYIQPICLWVRNKLQ